MRLLLLLLYLSATCPRLSACTCLVGENPCSDAANPGTAVFVGVVIRGDENGPARVRIEQALQSVPQGVDETDIHTWRGTSCHHPLAVGERWVFVTSSPYSVGGCSPSFRLAGNEHKLDALRQAILHRQTSITGSVVDDEQKPLARVRVELRSVADGTPHVYVTDKGEYAFENVAPGTYTLRADVRGLGVEPQTVEVQRNWCVVRDLHMSGQVAIRGRVTDRTSGRQLAGVVVDLYRFSESGELASQPIETVVSAEDGTYRFEPAKPGGYRIEPRWKQPSGPGPLMILAPGAHSTHELRLPIPRKPAKLRVRFTDGDGTPMSGVLLRVYNPRTGETFSHDSGTLSEVASDIFAREQYDLTADRTLPGATLQVVSGSASISLANDTNDVTIVLRPLP